MHKKSELTVNGWSDVIFSDVIDVNPIRLLKKGTNAKDVSMADLKEFQRKIDHYKIRPYKGGSKFKNGDTLMARITPCLENGKTALVDFLQDKEIGFGSTEFIILSARNGLTDPYFVYYLSLTPEVRNAAIKSMTGTSGRQRVENDVFDSIIINLPPLPVQRAIANILSDFDEKIELNRQMNKTLESIAQAIFKHWFIDFEFPNERGKPYKLSGGKMVESELGKIPAGWDVGTFKDALLTIESGSRPKGGIGSYSEGIPSIGAENILGLGQYDYSKTKYVPIDFYNQMKAGHIRNDDVLLYKDGAQLGRKSIFMDDFPFTKCCINEHVFILRPKEKITSAYLYLWLDQNWVTNEIVNLNANSAQPGINQDGVNSLSIIIPKVNIIKRFDNKIKPIFSRIFNDCLESNNLSQIRDSLLLKLMSGKLELLIKVIQKKGV